MPGAQFSVRQLLIETACSLLAARGFCNALKLMMLTARGFGVFIGIIGECQ
jgi:hypothetical protein